MTSTRVVMPQNRVMSGNRSAGNILDFLPMQNIMPFGMCTMPNNPLMAAVTVAANGACVLHCEDCIRDWSVELGTGNKSNSQFATLTHTS